MPHRLVREDALQVGLTGAGPAPARDARAPGPGASCGSFRGMSSRVTGAGLALIAVALLAVSLLAPAVLPGPLSLFAGHPTVTGHTRTTQDFYVGLYSVQLCNSGGDGTCKSGDPSGAFRAFGYAELGVAGALAAGALALGLLTLRRSERRKLAARIVWVAGGLAIACAVPLVLLDPVTGATAPIGIGMVLHALGILGAMIGGALAIRPPPPIRLRVAERGPQPHAALPTAQAFSRRAGRGEGPPPGEPAHDPRLGHDPRLPAPAAARPPFAPGPQLRPLYDANPAHGGTGGLLPMERPPIPAGPAPVTHPAAPMTATPPGLLGADEPTAAAPPLADPRPALPFADPPRPIPPFGDAPRPMPPFGDASRPMPPFGDASQAMPPLFTPEELDEPRPPPPLPASSARVAPPTAPPPLPTSSARVATPTAPPPLPASIAAAAALPTAVHPAHKPRTQVSLVPPMPDNDLPIAPPTAQIVADGDPGTGGSPSRSEPTQFPRAETPLAPPPPPIAPPPPIRREPPPPRPGRDSQAPRPAALRAAVPMPARSTPSPTRPPLPAARGAPPRPTIATTVPPIPAIPAIPAIPPIPPPRRADTDITDPDGSPTADAEGATVSRVPVEVGDYVSQTNVSVDLPVPEDGDAVAAAGRRADAADRPGHLPDTSPSGEPVAPFRTGAAERPEAMASAAAIASRPTIQAAAQVAPRAADQPTIIAPPLSPLPPMAPAATPAPSTPAVRDRPMPKLPISTAPDSLPPPRDGKPASGPSPACPQCEAPMAWVEEHLRFYCKSCRMYF